MIVIIRNTPIELPDLEAEFLIQAGLANLPEMRPSKRATRYESSGTPTHRSPAQVTESKPQMSVKGSKKKTTK